MLGIRQFFRLAADQSITNSAVLVAVNDFTIPVAANQRITLVAKILITVGGAGGVRFLFTAPAVSDAVQVSQVSNTVAPSITANAQFGAPLVVVTNALASAGNHWIDISTSFVTTAAGNIVLTMAQNTADATPLVIQANSYIDTVTV